MNKSYSLPALWLLAGLLANSCQLPGAFASDPTDSPQGPTALRSLLDEAIQSGDLPTGMVIRVSACLGARADDVDDSSPEERRELWEISRGWVHRVTFESEMGKSAYRRVESRAFDTRGISRTLLEGKAIQIQARKGEGPEVAFVGTRYQLGSRSIEVVWKGKILLNLLETRAAGLSLYRESDARAFGALYEQLASPIRAKFKP